MATSWQTFDIFDTVLARRLAAPSDVFVLLHGRLKKEGHRMPPAGTFAWLRGKSERWSRRFHGVGHPSLEDIYRVLGRILGWSGPMRARAMAVERELERSFLQATPFGRRAVSDARKEGSRIAFVSDMYLDSEFLGQVLKREGLMENGDLLIVSNEVGKSKADGTIWPLLLERIGCGASELHHRGDNIHGDFDSPREAGISATTIGTGSKSRWESAAGPDAPAIRDFGGIAALSRLARASCPEPEDYWTTLGTGVLGPLLAGFSAWILEQAKQEKIGTLWFLSRDGWLFREACSIMADRDAPRMEYFCAGRHQLHLAAANPPATTAEGIFGGSRRPSLALVAKRLCLDGPSLLELRAGTGTAGLPEDAVLDGEQQSKIVGFVTHPEWLARLAALREAQRAPVLGYLEEMAARAAGPVGVVDVGWLGRSQDILERLLPHAGVRGGFYLGVTGAPPPAERKRGWLYDKPRGAGQLKLDRHQRLFEVLIGGVSGPLRGYREENGHQVPVFEDQEKGEFAPGRGKAQEAAMAFVRLAADPAYSDWWSVESLREFSARNLTRLFESPTAGDALRFKDWTVTTDEAHLDGVALARGYDLKRIGACLRKEEPWAWLWPAASLRNSTRAGRSLMRAARLLKGA